MSHMSHFTSECRASVKPVAAAASVRDVGGGGRDPKI